MATRWGICGAGKISDNFTVALKKRPAEDHQVVAVAARKLEDAQEFSRKHNISKAYGSYEELARDPDVDVVYVGVVHPCHLNACKLFINAKKNVLCEKPLAMNAKEVKEILDSAEKNDVFLMEAAWTRFFPASVQIRNLLAQEYIGEVKMVRADYGVPRSDQKELGGGALLDLGIYCLQFISMVYNGEKPESIQASGVCLETGVNKTLAVILKYSKNRMAMFTCFTGVQLHNDAIIVGTKGKIQVPSPMWCPTSLVVNKKETQYPVPEPSLPLNFTNSTGKRFEAGEVRQCLLKGNETSAFCLLKHSISRVYGSYEELARDPDMDIVHVGVIPPYHLNACKLFINAKKNVLSEKSLAMNTKEVKEILDSAKKNNVFLMEAAWTRFFQASVQIRNLLSWEYIGEVKMVRADYGVPLLHMSRSDQKDRCEGALLGLGICCLQFICMVYKGEKPESIQASGTCLETGVDETVAVILRYSKNRMAMFTCSAGVELHSDAIIVGTKGTIQVLSPMWCPTSLVVNRKETQQLVPEPSLSLNFTYSTGKRCEVEEVRQCLLKGLKESPVMSHAYTLLLAEMGDEICQQVGGVYSQDYQNMATRWGICSVGKISHDFTVALKTLPAEDHQVVAVAARKLEDAQEFSRKHNISKAYGSYEELARDPDVDVVYVGVVHPCHLNACKLFINAKKNVLCEKPLAMNTKEVKEILDSAKKNNVFLMEVAWTRFFPASVEIRKLLAEEYIGEVKMVRADFGVPLFHVPRSDQKDLGGGALLGLGISCLQFISMVYNREKPESIQASGICLETGVDESVAVILQYSKNRMAMFTCSAGVHLHGEAFIAGTNGIIEVLSPMWCPTALVVNEKVTQYPVPEPHLPLNFTYSTGMRYEAEEVRQCLLKGNETSAFCLL
uniref:Trans-1,2-dihydrobenzene-1,2-diol dehydrogenase n=1 Tax=Poecilia latipinna TaxID=48699 RepID=A0A3B3VLB7_9TELE